MDRGGIVLGCKVNKSFIMEVQAALNRLGYNAGPVDGIHGPATQSALRKFQSNYGIRPTGVFGEKTCELLERYFAGYFIYTIKPKDTFFKIAAKYKTTVQSIIIANPGKDPNRIGIGEKITVPFGYDVVDATKNYSYDVMDIDMQGLKARYPFLEIGIIGKSALGRNLYYIRLGRGAKQIFYNGAHHGLEWITSVLLMKFAENFLKNYTGGRMMNGYDTGKIWNEASIYIVPMVNPDGIDLVLNGLSKDNPNYSRLIEWNGGSTDFSLNWQANNRGVDLNHNYDALWNLSKEAEMELGITGPGPTRFGGPYPESEPESNAVADFTRTRDFRLVIAYHTQGEVIYWTFQNMQPAEAKRIGESFSKLSGYALDEPVGVSSLAGYKDWFIQQYGRPGYTIEAGKGKNPLPISQFPKIYSDNVRILLEAAFV